jgi:prepilin-type processing-associated H-X9-DG protein
MNRVASWLVAGLMLLVLVALGLPALLRWRTMAERARCQDHLRRLAGMALGDYAKGREAYPAGTVANKDLPPERRLSWVVEVLHRPGLNRGDLAVALDRSAAWDAKVNQKVTRTMIVTLLCPGIAAEAADDPSGRLHYLGIAGVGTDAATLEADNVRAGVFRYNSPTPLAAISDGFSNVLLLMESGFNVGPWGAGGPTSVRAVVPGQQPYIGPERPFGAGHLGGVNVAFADGSVRYLTDRIDPTVLEMLAAMADGQAANGLPD